MRILFGTTGTRGDVEPCIALARALGAAGCEVTLGTHEDYEAEARRHGLEFRRVGGSFKAIAQSDLGRAWLDSGSNPLRYARLLDRIFTPLQQGLIDDADEAMEGHDALVFYPLATHFMHAAERRGLPIVGTPFIPWVPTARMAPVVLPQHIPTGFLRARLGHLVHAAMLRPFNPGAAAHRERVGLPPMRGASMTLHAFACGVPHVHLYSEQVVPRPDDWPAWAELGGFCFLDEPGYEPPPALEAFLSAGPPPIYVGFGSMTGLHPDALGAVIEQAVVRAGVRAVVATGWGAIRGGNAHPDIFHVEDVPHRWLFPRVGAVVHHGGVGTLAAGLRAGRPTVVVPFFGDQPFWASRVCALGVGPPPVPRQRLTAPRLATAITAALAPPMVAAAERLGRALTREDGLTRSAERVLDGLERQRRSVRSAARTCAAESALSRWS